MFVCCIYSLQNFILPVYENCVVIFFVVITLVSLHSIGRTSLVYDKLDTRFMLQLEGCILIGISIRLFVVGLVLC